jgi:hypothetical protein
MAVIANPETMHAAGGAGLTIRQDIYEAAMHGNTGRSYAIGADMVG